MLKASEEHQHQHPTTHSPALAQSTLLLGKEKLEKKEGRKKPSLKFRALSTALFFGFVFVFRNGALGNLGNHCFTGLPPPPGLCKAVGIDMPGAGLAAVSLPSSGFIILHLLRARFIPSN